MALIICPECNKEVSDKAKVCIHCGYPLQNTTCIINGDKYDLSFVLVPLSDNPVMDRGTKIGNIRRATEVNGYDIGMLNTTNILDQILQTGIIPESFDLPYPEYVTYFNTAGKEVVCPTCKSTNIEKIGFAERAVSVGVLGIFSKKINKSFKCKNCGYTW